MTWEVIVEWSTVFLGLALAILALRAVFYFRGVQRALVGGSWVVEALYRVCLTVTVASAWLTLARAVTLTYGPQPLISITSSVVIIWLLLTPPLLQAEFRSHEGR